MTEERACLNTDRELWRESDDYYSASIHVTAHNGIGIDVGGTVYVMPLREWHSTAERITALTEQLEQNKRDSGQFSDEAIRERENLEAINAALVTELAQAKAEIERLKDEQEDYKGRLWCALGQPMNIEFIAAAKETKAERDTLRAQLEENENYRGLFEEIVKRLRAALVVSGLEEWTEWDAAIRAFVKAAQAQAHLVKLASERYDQLLCKDREIAEIRAQLERMSRKVTDVEWLEHVPMTTATKEDVDAILAARARQQEQK